MGIENTKYNAVLKGLNSVTTKIKLRQKVNLLKWLNFA